jgi:outer membrane protein assembly factor BamB
MKNFGWTLAWTLAAVVMLARNEFALAIELGGLSGPPRPPALAQSPAGWPQWGGPTRDFKVPAGRLAPWPASGPREIWTRTLGEGYSAIAADGSALFTQYRPEKGVAGSSDTEVVVALDSATGRTLWEHRYEAPAPSGIDLSEGPGPHATPLVVGGLVYAVGATGKLHALDKGAGRVVWAHDLWRELNGKVQGRGYSCSPMAYGSHVIVTVGGAGQTLAAFDLKTGRLAWKNGDLDPAPSSPMLITVNGQEQIALFYAEGVAGFDPRNGALLWSHPHRTNWGLNITMPVWGEDNLLFISSAYGGGSRVLQLTQAGGRTTVKELWADNRMRIHFGNAIRLGDHVYGSSGDFGPAVFTAVNVRTGDIAWQTRDVARASSVYGDGKFVILDEEGTLYLATATPQALQVHAKAQVLSGRSWTVPTLVGTRVYVRDRTDIKALELG